MTNPTPPSESPKITPLRCMIGSITSGAIAFALYGLTVSIVQGFANKPIHFENPITQNIAAAVRTLVMGVSMMATGIFAIVTLGLTALALQLIIQNLTNRSTST